LPPDRIKTEGAKTDGTTKKLPYPKGFRATHRQPCARIPGGYGPTACPRLKRHEALWLRAALARRMAA